MSRRTGLLPLAICCFALALLAQPRLFSAELEESGADAIAAGHSYHGEAFNEGPRQTAHLMEGLPEIDFPTSATDERTQAFFEQGVAQLHGCWYLEAERSFRQAAAAEPELAIAYWGMAMANVNNRTRARGLIEKAMELKSEGTTDRERQYIEALDRYLADAGSEKKDSDKKEEKGKRAERYVADLEQILHEYPDDIEAKAFLAVHLWMFEREGVKMPSRYAVDALLGDVFDVQPMHPAHHYRIHLWDNHRPENALESAAKCGPSAPAIAHMWHMPGHIYSRLHRYGDAAWQQEASARVDHAHLSRARLMPDQIHNFAHNNEWLTRNLIHVGRVQDALIQARNLVSLPRHPEYNSMQKNGSFKYGHQRLLQVLTTYGLWEQLIEEAEHPYLAVTGDEKADQQRTAWLAVAHTMADNRRRGGSLQRQLQRRQLDLQDALYEIEASQSDRASTDETKTDEGKTDDGKIDDQEAKKLKEKIEELEPLLARVAAAVAAVDQDPAAVRHHAKAAKLDNLLQARWLAMAGDVEGAIEIAQKAVNEGEGEVPPLAVLVDLLWQQGKQEEAKEKFAALQTLACDADLETPLLQKLTPVPKAAEAAEDWRIKPAPAEDLGERPALDQLGPFRWQSYTAPSWQATNAEEEIVDDSSFAGRPRIMIFYLGFGCLHCVEQLHAFAPQVEAFRDAGIELVALSTENTEQLQLGIKNFDKDLPVPLMADPQQEVFKKYACWDDFEQQPLHGTFLIDGSGLVRWQDIGHEPFNDADFLLEEAKRLLMLANEGDGASELAEVKVGQ